VEPLRVDGEANPHYVARYLSELQLPSATSRIRDVKSRMQRMNPVVHQDEYLALAGELFSLEQHARALREQAAGGW
jgi:DNA primase